MLSFCRKATKIIKFSFKLLLCGINWYFTHLFFCLRGTTKDCIYVLKIQKGLFYFVWVLHPFTETLTQ